MRKKFTALLRERVTYMHVKMLEFDCVGVLEVCVCPASANDTCHSTSFARHTALSNLLLLQVMAPSRYMKITGPPIW